MSRWRAAFALALLAAGAVLLAGGGWIHAKAWLAQRLLGQAWASTLADGGAHKPWSWADHWPVARLRAPGLDAIVLEGDQGHALAFGPGHNVLSGLPGDGRTIIISAHRDTQFRSLGGLAVGDVVELETPAGRFRYRVRRTAVLDTRSTRLRIDDHAETLVLVTCWPFAAPLPGGPLRYAVVAEPVTAASATAAPGSPPRTA